MNDKLFSLLGFARRAGKVSLGHDAVISSIVHNKAKLCIVSEDASQRLKNELEHACNYDNKAIPYFELPVSKDLISKAVGQKMSTLTVDDEGFATAIIKLIQKG